MSMLVESSWQPTATIENLRARADIISHIRQFFNKRNVLEVDTPVMCHCTVTDPYLHSITAECHAVDGSHREQLYLQTSPEYAMKRLLSAGCGSIYQLCKAFRNGEIGRHHNPEFTMLEWYRLDFDHHDLMREMDELLQFVIHSKPAKKYSYAALFEKYLQINPHDVSIDEVKICAQQYQLNNVSGIDENDRDVWLQLLMSDAIEPRLEAGVVFIYDYPVTQAALARINEEMNVAERFEVYINGIELANGFHELSNATEQRKRFENDLVKRTHCGYPLVELDERFLAAIEHGLPNCAGVALGIDRLVMIALNETNIENVISFSIQDA